MGYPYVSFTCNRPPMAHVDGFSGEMGFRRRWWVVDFLSSAGWAVRCRGRKAIVRQHGNEES